MTMDKQTEVDTLMGILAIYCDFAKKGLLRGSGGKLPLLQQEAIDQFAQANDCRIFWHDKHKCHLWTRLETKEDPA